MPFPQNQVAWLLANREKIARYLFIPQFLAAALFLSFAYGTGRVHAHLLFKGARTRGTIVDLKPVKFSNRSSSGSTWYTTIYEPLVEFNAGDRVVRFQEWKGSESRVGMGWSVPVIYDPADPSFAMIDRGSWNWLPWAPCFVIGLPVALASLKGFFAFFTRRPRTPDLSPS
jgi:hypothetical protein